MQKKIAMDTSARLIAQFGMLAANGYVSRPDPDWLPCNTSAGLVISKACGYRGGNEKFFSLSFERNVALAY
jgi:hypothetical protein